MLVIHFGGNLDFGKGQDHIPRIELDMNSVLFFRTQLIYIFDTPVQCISL